MSDERNSESESESEEDDEEEEKKIDDYLGRYV